MGESSGRCRTALEPRIWDENRDSAQNVDITKLYEVFGNTTVMRREALARHVGSVILRGFNARSYTLIVCDDFHSHT